MNLNPCYGHHLDISCIDFSLARHSRHWNNDMLRHAASTPSTAEQQFYPVFLGERHRHVQFSAVSSDQSTAPAGHRQSLPQLVQSYALRSACAFACEVKISHVTDVARPVEAPVPYHYLTAALHTHRSTSTSTSPSKSPSPPPTAQ